MSEFPSLPKVATPCNTLLLCYVLSFLSRPVTLPKNCLFYCNHIRSYIFVLSFIPSRPSGSCFVFRSHLCPAWFYSVLFESILFCSVLLCSMWSLFCSALSCPAQFCSVQTGPVPLVREKKLLIGTVFFLREPRKSANKVKQ